VATSFVGDFDGPLVTCLYIGGAHGH
jgi:hypothetical protein